ncbi:hypothetical protein, partial [Brevibacillus aydinogluensis]|uniref:hypothetical protein n=1 Tax=Brevibacillus aydinogluensis TaxID=927786 RepID=UPI002893523C
TLARFFYFLWHAHQLGIFTFPNSAHLVCQIQDSNTNVTIYMSGINFISVTTSGEFSIVEFPTE